MNAVHTKDAILSMLNVEDHTLWVKNANLVLDVLRLTKGMWAELNYAYKAIEIATRVFSQAQNAAWDTTHAGRKRILETLAFDASVLSQEYQEIHHTAMSQSTYD